MREDEPRYSGTVAMRPRKYSDDQLIAALIECKGMVYIAAAKVGCNADTIYEHARTNPALKEVMRSERGKVVDKAEMKLFDAIEAGESWAIQMALRCLGKDRGYVERSEVKFTGEELDRAISAELERLTAGRKNGLPPAAQGNRNGHTPAG